ncbi:hypothetical protein tinsulaeT_00220 [Thalassotalea insulae]|uniref:DUF4359 domain-containing protein n=1 Tax=Thalassotalea insulae TaxID=2056778 RepID=A0ABQ6GQ53_9GAMM|nr:hypothetical protein [Thalassotalea insulae]GLX76682.1 hypothetical protein tinsulaeT_00220 [Thalassotalea insulae]
MDGTSKAWLALILRDFSQAFIRPILRRYMQKEIMRHLLLLLFLVANYSVATDVVSCDSGNEKFIRSSIGQSKVSKPYSPSELAKEFELICEIKDPKMMDGLVFLLYKNSETGFYYIGLYNGLDGSNQMNGPFVR